MQGEKGLRSLLVLAGLAITALGLNIGLGGIRTLGWQGLGDFVAVRHAADFAVQDSHVRFLGGLWFAVGLAFLWGGLALQRLRTTLILLCGAIALAGLFRLSGLAGGALPSAVLPSLGLELLGFPALAFWLRRSGARGGAV